MVLAFPTFSAGMVLSISLIMAIGPQNAHVLRMGLQRQHLWLTVAVCALADVALIGLGVLGLAQLGGLSDKMLGALVGAEVLPQYLAGLAKARDQLSYATLRADADGVVTAVSAEVGQMTVPGNTVVTLARTDIREAVIDLPDPVVALLAVGARFRVQLQADLRVTAEGTVREIAPAADAVTRLRRVKVALESPPEAMRLGSTIRARPVEARSAGLIELPAAAVFRRGEEERVWIVGGQGPAARSVPVRVAERDEKTVRVAEGVAEGDRVVVAGANRLAEGQIVKGGETSR